MSPSAAVRTAARWSSSTSRSARVAAPTSTCRTQTRCAALPEPGARDRVGKAESVADHRRLLRVAVQPLVDGYRQLAGRNAPFDRLDQELRGVELLLAQDELRQDRGPYRPIAVGAVRDPGSGDQRNEPIEENDAELAGGAVGLGLAQDAGAVGDV